MFLGSLAFGIGWGLTGFCPGPALVALGAGYGKALCFVLAMLVGMLVFNCDPMTCPSGKSAPQITRCGCRTQELID